MLPLAPNEIYQMEKDFPGPGSEMKDSETNISSSETNISIRYQRFTDVREGRICCSFRLQKVRKM